MVVTGKVVGVGLAEHIKSNAEKLKIEGVVQRAPGNALVVLASGTSDDLECLIDEIYTGNKKAAVENVAISPMVTHKDFHGVFRIIENEHD
jgi:acylphosphatase